MLNAHQMAIIAKAKTRIAGQAREQTRQDLEILVKYDLGAVLAIFAALVDAIEKSSGIELRASITEMANVRRAQK